MDKKYDVIIIGAGIGGLVSACYLSKAGFKVLIVEKHSKPGGYCTSFDRKGFRFDVGVHYLGSLRKEEGILFKILNDLDLSNKLDFITNDPTDRIIIPGKTIFIRADKNRTKEELFLNFPKEKENINKFFEFILNKDFFSLVSKTKSITFGELLSSFFQDAHLKAILSCLLGNMGLPSTRASALVACILFEEYILDGGYYPKGGVQIFPDALSNQLKKFGGELLLSKEVKKIILKNGAVSGIKLVNGDEISTKYVISNADANLTFSFLLDQDSQERKIAAQLSESPSAFVIYLGLRRKLQIKPKHFTTWYFTNENVDDCYSKELDMRNNHLNYVLCTFASQIDPSLAPEGKDTLRIFVGANYQEKSFWNKNKEIVYRRILNKTQELLGDIEDDIEEKVIGTPHTFHRYTFNKNGALFGWAAIPTQINRTVMPPETSIKNLFLCGHWVTNGIGQGGVATVALSGKNAARLIIKQKNNSL